MSIWEESFDVIYMQTRKLKNSPFAIKRFVVYKQFA